MEKSDVVYEVGLYNYIKGNNLSSINNYTVDINNNNGVNYFKFVFDGNINTILEEVNNDLFNYSCNCDKFIKDNACEHIACAMINYEPGKNNFFDIEAFSNDLVANLLQEEKKTEIIHIKMIFKFCEYQNKVTLKPKIGINKYYSLSNKFKDFLYTYKNEIGKTPLGKDFVYDPTIHKFSEKQYKLLDYLIGRYVQQKNNYVPTSKVFDVSFQEFEYVIDLLDNEMFEIEKIGKFNNIIVDNPYDISIKKEENKYLFRVDFDSATKIGDNFLYAYKKKFYKIPSMLSNLYNQMYNNEIEELVLDEKQAILLSKRLYDNIKDTLIVEEDIKDKFVVQIPKVKLYFDFKDKIVGKIMFTYNEKEVNFFDKEEMFRNETFESKVVEDLYHYKFILDKKKFVLENLDDMVYFIENSIFELGKKYEVFSSSKLKDANIINKSSISSQFSIGKDNIMRYEFELGDIDKSELSKIFKNIENKQKYYKLKNGKILNTQDDDLLKLQEVYENLDLDFDNDNGIIPKYRALYLDSIRDYNIINTNNVFDDFIRNFNMYKDSDINISIDDLSILREYQKTGVKWLYNIYKCGFGGILADEMGLGKTIQTIMFIKEVLKEKKDAKLLIVAPTSLIYNWEAEFDKFGSNLKYKVIADSKDKRIEALDGDYNIFITTYGLLRQDKDIYLDKTFELVIIDEGQNIKNPKAGISQVLKSVNANIKIALTGTPIENSVLEIWSIFDFIMPGYLNSLSNFQKKYNIKDITDEKREALVLLSQLIKPFILRRKKKEVLVDLPDKIENKIYLDLVPQQKQLYAATVRESKKEFEELMEKEGFLAARFKILQLLTKLRQICIDPSIVYDDFNDCSVKMDEMLNLLRDYIDNGHKVLVFTSFKSALDILKKRLDTNKISNYVIDGSVTSKNRAKLVDSFNKDNTNVFLITLKAGGTGLNLTSADVVIHLDLWWNPQAENQATDRAHRIGQKNTVEVVKLVCKGTIEEKIVLLQEKKKVLNDTLIDNDSEDVVISKLDENDIKDLLSYND